METATIYSHLIVLESISLYEYQQDQNINGQIRVRWRVKVVPPISIYFSEDRN